MTLSGYPVKNAEPLKNFLPKTLQRFQRRETIPLNQSTLSQILHLSQ
jgi:hypothetical protein